MDNTKFPVTASMDWAGVTWSFLAVSTFSGSVNTEYYKAMTRNAMSGDFDAVAITTLSLHIANAALFKASERTSTVLYMDYCSTYKELITYLMLLQVSESYSPQC